MGDGRVGRLAAGAACALERYVSLDGGHDAANGFTNWAGAATGIQYAVDAADAGETVWVSNGTYAVGSTVKDSVANRVMVGKAVVVRSLDDDPARTLIRGEADVRPVWLANGAALIGFTLSNGVFASRAVNGCGLLGESTNTVVSNCVIVNNSGPAAHGGGAAYATLYDCRVSANSATNGGGLYRATAYRTLLAGNIASNLGGGAVGLVTTNYSLTDCTLSANTARDGGGAQALALYGCLVEYNTGRVSAGGVLESRLYDGTIQSNTAATGSGGGAYNCSVMRNCVLLGNTAGSATVGGGGFYGGGVLSNCQLIANSAYQGGGVYGSGTGLLKMFNCLIYKNTGSNAGGGVRYATLYHCTLSANSSGYGGGIRASTNINCISWGNSRKDEEVVNFYSCGLSYAGQGSTTSDPLFLESTNLRLQAESPCINTGTNLPDMDGAPDLDERRRPDRFSGRADMGCFEYLPAGALLTIQ